MNRVLIIGIDGGDPNLINKWKSDLPNIAYLIQHGVSGELDSTMPPFTCPAWNSMITGKNPGKLGFYGFMTIERSKVGLNVRPMDYSQQKAPSLWRLLSEQDKKVIVINVPIMSFPEKLNGFTVAGGIAAYPGQSSYTFPPELQDKLEENIGYRWAPPPSDSAPKGQEQQLIDLYINNIRKELELANYLMQTIPWEMMFVVFQYTDFCAHHFWHYVDKDHPNYKESLTRQFENPLKKIYQATDDAIGELISNIEESTSVLLVSDHGVGPRLGYFMTNKWLLQEGFLKLKRSRAITWHNITGLFSNSVKTVLKKYLSNKRIAWLTTHMPKRVVKPFMAREQKRAGATNILERIDWTNTKAYAVPGVFGIFLNVKGREPEGIISLADYDVVRDELIGKLKLVKNPDTNQPAITEIHRREEVYSGAFLDLAPDISFLIENNKFEPSAAIGGNTLWKQSPTSGGHTSKGIFMAYGPDIKESTIINSAHICDVTPTTLHILDCSIPPDTDGRVLTDIFVKGSEAAKRAIKVQQHTNNHFKEDIKSRISKIKKSGRI